MSGREFKRDAGLNYCSGQSISELQSALASVVLDQKLSEIAKSQLYSLINILFLFPLSLLSSIISYDR